MTYYEALDARVIELGDDAAAVALMTKEADAFEDSGAPRTAEGFRAFIAAV